MTIPEDLLDYDDACSNTQQDTEQTAMAPFRRGLVVRAVAR